MTGLRFVLCCVVVWVSGHDSETTAYNVSDGSKRNNSNLALGLALTPAFAQLPTNSSQMLKLKKTLDPDCSTAELIGSSTFNEKQENSVKNKGNHSGKNPNIFQRIGTFMMMIPIAMQLLQLPVSIATIKMSFIKSILISKLALLLLFLRTVFMNNAHEKIIYIHSPKQQHEHYYLPFQDPEDSKPGWLGEPPTWLI